MARQVVTVVRVKGEKPRRVRLDDSIGPNGEQTKNGASVIEAYEARVRRGELFSVAVDTLPAPEPDQDQAVVVSLPVPAKRTAKKAAAAE